MCACVMIGLNNSAQKDTLIPCIEVAARRTSISTEGALAVLTFLFEKVQRSTSTSNTRFGTPDRVTCREITG